MKQALILGCSHAAGSEISTNAEYNYLHSYPSIIAQSLGYTIDNRAIAGGSNDAIFRILTETISTLTNSDIIIACWSGCNRTEIVDRGVWIPLAPMKQDMPLEYQNYLKQWIVYHADHQTGKLNKIKNILSTNLLATEAGVPIINIDSFWSLNKTIWPKLINWPVNISFCDWCKEQNYPHTEWGHFLEPAHQAFGNFVLKSMPQ